MDFPEHIRGARGILGWSQPEVAEKTGLSLQAVRNAEEGVEVKQSTKNALTLLYLAEGFEFTAEGISKSNVSSYVLPSYLDLLDDVSKTIQPGGEVLKHCVDDRRSDDATKEKVNQMREAGIKERLTISEENDFIAGDPDDYRKIPKDYFAESEVTVMYADKIAFFVQSQVLVIRSEYLSRIFRKQFEYWWKTGVPVNVT